MAKVQRDGGLSFRVEKRGKDDVAIVMIRGDSSEEARRDRARIAEILGLELGLEEYRLVFGRQASARNEIAMLTRSIIEMLVDLAAWIDVPPEHVASGRVHPRPDTDALEEFGFEPLIRVHSSTARPESSFVTVRYDGLWYWIDKDDFRSKRTLSFMQLMFSLAESGGGQTAPVVTGAGGRRLAPTQLSPGSIIGARRNVVNFLRFLAGHRKSSRDGACQQSEGSFSWHRYLNTSKLRFSVATVMFLATLVPSGADFNRLIGRALSKSRAEIEAGEWEDG